MGQEEVKQEVGPPIFLNSETGELKIDEARFSLAEKPYTVRLLFKTYRECKEFIEQVCEVIEDITEIQDSCGGLNQLLACRNEDSAMDLIDI